VDNTSDLDVMMKEAFQLKLPVDMVPASSILNVKPGQERLSRRTMKELADFIRAANRGDVDPNRGPGNYAGASTVASKILFSNENGVYIKKLWHVFVDRVSGGRVDEAVVYGYEVVNDKERRTVQICPEVVTGLNSSSVKEPIAQLVRLYSDMAAKISAMDLGTMDSLRDDLVFNVLTGLSRTIMNYLDTRYFKLSIEEHKNPKAADTGWPVPYDMCVLRD